MKKILFVLLVAASAVACKKEYKSVYTFESKANKAKVKFVHTIVNAYPLPDTTAQSALQVYINDNKITGTTSPLFGYGGNVFPNLEYTMLPAGDVNLKAIIAERPNIPAIPVLNTTIKLEDQQTYTVFLTDSLPTPSAFLIKEDFIGPKADSGKYFVRLANMAMNSSPLEFYAVTDAASLNTGVTNKMVTDFKQVNVGTGTRTFAVRLPGMTTNLASTSLTPVAGRMYTFVTYGVQGKAGSRIGRLTYYTSRFQTYSF